MEIDRAEIGRRIKEALNRAKVSQKQLAAEVGVQPPSITAYVQGTSNIPVEVYEAISRLCKVSIDWLILGASAVVAETGEIYPAESPNTITLPVLALAGAGEPCCIDQLEPIGHITLEKSYNGPNIHIVQIRGNSMEPTVMDGSHVGIDISDKEIISGQMYAVFIPHEGVVVKRIWIGPEMVKISSDNPSAPDHEMLAERINWETFIQGRVKWTIQKY